MWITFPRVSKTEYTVLISTHGMFQNRNYRDVKRKPLGTIDDEQREEIKLAETREYDINEILSKAKENKVKISEISAGNPWVRSGLSGNQIHKLRE